MKQHHLININDPLCGNNPTVQPVFYPDHKYPTHNNHPIKSDYEKQKRPNPAARQFLKQTPKQNEYYGNQKKQHRGNNLSRYNNPVPVEHQQRLFVFFKFNHSCTLKPRSFHGTFRNAIKERNANATVIATNILVYTRPSLPGALYFLTWCRIAAVKAA